MSKVTGTVKWFSNRKGFGFVAPTSDNAPTKDEIFVHQTSIFSDGAFRTLADGAEIEFDIVKEEDSGKWKAINVTAPGGGSIKPPPRERRRRSRKKEDSEEDGGVDGNDGDGEGKEAEASTGGKPRNRRNRRSDRKNKGEREQTPPFHSVLDDDVKKTLSEKGIELGDKTTIDLAIGSDVRLKLGQGGYTSIAVANGTIGEGTYACDEKGLVTMEWTHCLQFSDGDWKTADAGDLVKAVLISGDDIAPVEKDDTPEKLWGDGKTDPKKDLEENGFQMRRVVLTRPLGGGRGRRNARNRGGDNSADGVANVE